MSDPILILSEDQVLDDLLVLLGEGLVGDGRDVASDSGGEGLAGVADEVADEEHLVAFYLVVSLYVEVPFVGHGEVEFGVVRGFDDEFVSHGCWAEFEG